MKTLKTSMLSVALLVTTAATSVFAQSASPSSDTAHPSSSSHLPVDVGLTYPVCTTGTRTDAGNAFSLNALIGLSGHETGLSLAGLGNIILDRANGLQLAGLLNYTVNTSKGVQMAGLMNVTGKNNGVGIAGLGNVSKWNASGVQVAGLFNKARNAGSQVAGLINVAKKVKGVQIAGLINIADSSDYPIAVFNFIKKGEKSWGLSTDESLTSLLTFRSGGRRLYGIASIGYNHKGIRQLAAWEAGIGAHVLQNGDFRLDLEAVNGGVTDFKHGDGMKNTFRILPSWRLSSLLTLYAGPSVNYFYTDRGQGTDMISHYWWSHERTNAQGRSTFKGLFFGVTGGIQVQF